MKSLNRYLLAAVCAALVGCAGLNTKRNETKDASQKTAAAEVSVKNARQSGAASCASQELKMAESDLKLAKSNLDKKAYGLALTLAKSADSYAVAATKKCEEAKRKEAEAKIKAKKK